MRAGACTILGIGVILIATPVWAAGGRYDPDYPVCMEAISSEGTRIDCMYTSMEQCRQGTYGSSGTCFNNPNYVPRPAEAAPTPTEPAPTAKTGKSAGRYDPDYPVCIDHTVPMAASSSASIRRWNSAKYRPQARPGLASTTPLTSRHLRRRLRRHKPNPHRRPNQPNQRSRRNQLNHRNLRNRSSAERAALIPVQKGGPRRLRQLFQRFGVPEKIAISLPCGRAGGRQLLIHIQKID